MYYSINFLVRFFSGFIGIKLKIWKNHSQVDMMTNSNLFLEFTLSTY